MTPTGEDPEMNWTLEVVVLPVSDISRSIEFYRDQVGFKLDHYTRNEPVAQLTTPGSGCSIVFGLAEPSPLSAVDERGERRRKVADLRTELRTHLVRCGAR